MTLQNQLDYLPSLLDGVVVPAGIDTNILKSQIMLECGLLTPLYSEPATMKAAIAQWFAARTWTFDHLLKIVNAEYSPIENYDRNEHWEKEIDSWRDITEQLSGKDQRDFDSTLSNSDTTERSVDGDLTTEQEVSPYNSSSYIDSQKSTVTDGQTITTETTYGRKDTQNDDITYGKKTTTDDDLDHNEEYTGRTHGNIGVTTNQQMIEQELDLLAKFNIYSWIAKQFCADLMLLLY